ncbi:MAG: SDR family oxidoreductase [Parvularculaceae bacterium]
MPKPRFLCLGFGYVAAAFARARLAPDYVVAGTTRSVDRVDELGVADVAPFLWKDDGIDPAAFDDVEAALVSVPPTAEGCPAFAAAKKALADRARSLKWVGYLSTNGVYGDHGGAWVDEASPLRPTGDRARWRIRAEADWAAFGVEHAVPVVVLRLPGIYGPGRSAIDSLRAGTAKRIDKPGQVFSRAHVDDIAAVVGASLANPGAGDLFNVADDEPAPPQDVVAYAAELLGVAPPRLVPFDEAELSEMARSFYADNKRVSNGRMKSALGVSLRYPTYREGLRAIFAGEGAAA